jgi:hypothetical protein
VARLTPTRDGWRAITQTPSLILAEIAWRWTFGIAMWAVLAYIALSSLGQVRVTDAEIKLIRAFDPYASSYVLLRVLNSIVPVMVRVLAYAMPALTVLWIAAATLGRAATLTALLGDRAGKVRWSALAGVNVLRAIVLFAAVLAFVGSSILVGRFFRGTPELLGAAILLNLGINLLILSVWSLLNWFLSLAPIFVMRDGVGTFSAFGISLDLFRERSGAYMGAAVALGLVRLLLLVLVSFISLIPLGMIGNSPTRAVVVVSVAVAIIYWALMDVVQIWRIAAYVSLAKAEPEAPVLTAPVILPEVRGPEVSAPELPENPAPEPSL